MTAAVTVTLPRMLADLVGSERRFATNGATVGDVLHAVTTRHPELSVHLFDEQGVIRQHVSVFRNDHMAEPEAAVDDGDRIVILQAVSGG